MTQKGKVVVVDDEEDMRTSISQLLSLSGYTPIAFDNAKSALSLLSPEFSGIILSDIRMRGMDGISFLQKLRLLDRNLPVILFTGHGDVPLAVEAMRKGAFDFVEKPFSPEKLLETIERAGEARRAALRRRALRRDFSGEEGPTREFIGQGEVSRALRENILNLAQADAPVLLFGETGTGKSLCAQAIHACGPLQGKNMITLDCSNSSDMAGLVLFEEASQNLTSLADKDIGTICLENIDALPADQQQQLLGFCERHQEGEMPRLITTTTQPVDIEKGVANLLPALFFRLAGLHLALPPLRERTEDIALIFNHYLELFSHEYGTGLPQIRTDDIALLLQSSWPGNIRQLMNLAEQTVLSSTQSDEETEARTAVPATAAAGVLPNAPRPLKDHVESFERMLIDDSLRRHAGSVAKVMEELSIPRRTLNEKMVKYGLSRTSYMLS